MAFDQELAERLRAVLATAAPVPPTERKMFGGLTFMVGGNMCCGVAGEDLVVRVGEAEASRALAVSPLASDRSIWAAARVPAWCWSLRRG